MNPRRVVSLHWIDGRGVWQAWRAHEARKSSSWIETFRSMLSLKQGSIPRKGE
jgi:hypothetical protein